PEATALLAWCVVVRGVCRGWVVFRGDSVRTALDVLHSIATAAGPAPLVTTGVLLVIGLALLGQIVPPTAVRRWEERFASLGLVPQALAVAGALTAIDVLGPEGVAPFIYFQF